MSGNLILVTGGTGHVGFRNIVEALQKGYRIRAAVRHESGIEQIKRAKSIQPYLDNIEFFIVPDILADGAYDEAIKGVDYVLHSASPLASKTAGDPEKNLFEPAVKGTTGILQSALKIRTIKRIVITASVLSIVSFQDLVVEVSEKVFNDTNRATTHPPPYTNDLDAYSSSKIRAFDATNNFVTKHKPHFEITNIMPVFIIGKSELVTSPNNITNGTNRAAMSPLLGLKNSYVTPSISVHVDDVAYAHVKALDPSVPGGQNFLLSSEGIKGTTWNDAIEIVKKHFPGEVKKGVFPLEGDVPTKQAKLDVTRTEKVLGLRFKSYEEQVISVAGHYVELMNTA
ncbi:MAG: hypothetical protein M1834_008673 [Cirrosporium novae-zelandiae]|nr:MAG: hypothetical protein M1834_008673 [Cirrosporium novae-zelandiae]